MEDEGSHQSPARIPELRLVRRPMGDGTSLVSSSLILHNDQHFSRAGIILLCVSQATVSRTLLSQSNLRGAIGVDSLSLPESQ